MRNSVVAVEELDGTRVVGVTQITKPFSGTESDYPAYLIAMGGGSDDLATCVQLFENAAGSLEPRLLVS